MSGADRVKVDKIARENFVPKRQKVFDDYNRRRELLTAPIRCGHAVPHFLARVKQLYLEEMQEVILAYADAYAEALSETGTETDFEIQKAIHQFATMSAEATTVTLDRFPCSFTGKSARLVGGWMSHVQPDVLQCRLSATAEAVAKISARKQLTHSPAPRLPEVSPVASNPLTSPAVQKVRARLRLDAGRLDELRLECGWSFDELALCTRIAKKSVLNHINKGKSVYPDTALKYATAFSKKLNRNVTVSELKSSASQLV